MCSIDSNLIESTNRELLNLHLLFHLFILFYLYFLVISYIYILILRQRCSMHRNTATLDNRKYL